MTAPIRIGNASGFYGDRFSAGPGDAHRRAARRADRRLPGRADHADPRPGPAEGPVARLRADVPAPARDRPRRRPSTAASRSSPTPAGSTRPAWPRRSRTLAGKLGLHPQDRVRRRRRPPATAAGSTRHAADRQRVPRRVGHRRVPARRRGRRGHRPGHRRLAWSSARPPPTTAGNATTSTRSPVPPWPGTSSSAAPRRPAATTRSSPSSATAAPARLPDRRDPRRRQQRHHQARRHRRRGHVDTVTAQLLYEIAGARLPRAGRDDPPRHDRARARTGPTGSGSAASRASRRRRRSRSSLNSARRVPQRGDVRPDRAGHRGQGGAGPAATRAGVAEATGRAGVVRSPAPSKPNADTEEAASALLTCAVKDPRPEAGRAGVLQRRGGAGACRATPASTSPRRPATARRTGSSPAGYVAHPRGRARRRTAGRRPRVTVEPAAETRPLTPVDGIELPMPLPQRRDGTQAPADARGPARPRRRCAVRGQGRRREPRRVGAQRRRPGAGSRTTLTVELFQELLPETAAADVDRYELPEPAGGQLRHRGLLGRGRGVQTRFDPQAKALGEWLRSRYVDVPEVLL